MIIKQQQLNIVEYPVLSLVKIVADLIDSIIATNDKLILSSHSYQIVTHFHSRAVPTISIYNYLMRILNFAPFSNEVLLSLLIFFDRIAKKRSIKYSINSLTAHRYLITSIVIASKFTSDIFYPNARYAKVGGISLSELNKLELEFLFLCNFNLHVKLEDMQAYGNQLLTHSLSQQCLLNKATEVNNSQSRSTIPPATQSQKRKRVEDYGCDSDDITVKAKIMKKAEAILDRALTPTTIKSNTSQLKRRAIYPSHLDTVTSN